MKDTENSLTARIQELRARLSDMDLKKTGYNAYAKFNYYQLEDFLPTVNKLCNELGMMPMFSITDEAGEKTATLHVFDSINTGDRVTYTIPFVTPKMGDKSNPIQELGAANTYLKRYLYMNFTELSEGDVVDATIGKEEPKEVKHPTWKQMNDFVLGYEDWEREKIREHFEVERDSELPQDVVKKYIEKRKDIIKQKNEELKKNALDVNEERKDFY